MDAGTLSNAALLVVTLLGMYASAFWLGLIIWTFRDHRARSRDSIATIAATLTVAVLNIPGLIIYLLLRPKETLSEAYERSLEEEALLQEIEEKPVCPGCSRHIHADWQLCPYCHTTLKQHCTNCAKLLELEWKICPYCATSQVSQPSETPLRAASRSNAPASYQEDYAVDNALPPENYTTGGNTLEYIENETYEQY